jgi:hypothetical protein
MRRGLVVLLACGGGGDDGPSDVWTWLRAGASPLDLGKGAKLSGTAYSKPEER